MNLAPLDEALMAMSALHDSLEPNDNGQQDAIVPAAALRDFVDTHARLLFERKQSLGHPSATDLRSALQAMVSAQHAGPITDEMHAAWRNAGQLLNRCKEQSHE